MNHATALLNELFERGVSVTAGEEGRLLVTPAAALTGADRDAIRAYKPQLLSILRGERPSHRPQSCNWCGNMSRARTCLEPEAAGVASYFHVIFVDLLADHGKTCPAYRSKGAA